jgi:hypothetical protein
MTEDPVQKQIQEQHTHRVGEDWDDSDEQAKVDLVNKIYKKNERRLEKARESIAALDDPETPTSAVIGHVYRMAYSDMQQALYEARVNGRDTEPFEQRLERFRSLVSPTKLAELSEKAAGLNRRPAEMRRVLDGETERKVQSLIDSTYSGTEVTKEGSTDEAGDGQAEV